MNFLEDPLFESGAYGPGTMTSIIKGKCYNRGVRAHKPTMEALLRLLWPAFLHCTANRPSSKENLDKEKLIDSMRAYCTALRNDDSIPQKAEVIASKLKFTMDLFDTF